MKTMSGGTTRLTGNLRVPGRYVQFKGGFGMTKSGGFRAVGIMIGVIILAAILICPASAVNVGCVIHIEKWMDANNNNVQDAGEILTTAQNGFAFKTIVNVPTIQCKNKDDISDNEELTAGSDGVAHISYSKLSCVGKVLTITEDLANSPSGWTSATPPIVYTCALNDAPEYVWRNVPSQPPNIPEFPTVAVSLGILMGLGLVVYTIRRKDQQSD